MLWAWFHPDSTVYIAKRDAEPRDVIHFKNGSVIKVIKSTADNVRGKRSQIIWPLYNADGTADYYFDDELLDEVLAPFQIETKDTFDKDV